MKLSSIFDSWGRISSMDVPVDAALYIMMRPFRLCDGSSHLDLFLVFCVGDPNWSSRGSDGRVLMERLLVTLISKQRVLRSPFRSS